MKKKRFIFLSIVIAVFYVTMQLVDNVYAEGFTLPADAPFTAIYVGAGSPNAVEQIGTVNPNDQMVPKYLVTVPEGTDSVVVFFPMSLGLFDSSICVSGYAYDGDSIVDDMIIDAFSEDGENIMTLIPVDDYLAEKDCWICPMVAEDCSPVCAFTFAFAETHHHNWGSWEELDDKQHKRVCTEDNSHVEKQNHVWTISELVAAGEYSLGLDQYECSVCGAKKEVKTLPTSGKLKVSNAAELVDFAKNAPVGAGILLMDDIDLTNVNWTGIPVFSGDFDGQGHTIKITNGTNGLFVTVAGKSKDDRSKIENVTIEGTISGSGCVGGVAGTAYYADFSNCFNKASITGTYGGNSMDYFVGGIVGKAMQAQMKGYVSFTNCGNEGSITGKAAVGGIFGHGRNGIVVDSCYNQGIIIGATNSEKTGGAGGIAGFCQGPDDLSEFINVYNTGEITGIAAVGGLVGSMYNGVKITNGYNSGSISGNRLTGAIAGNVYDNRASAGNCYYLDTSCDQAASSSTLENIETIDAVSKTEEELKDDSIVTLLGSSFASSLGYPVLIWEAFDPEGNVYNISAPTVEGVKFFGPKLASSETPYNFKVTIDRYHKLTADFAVKINEETISPVSISGDPLSQEGVTYSYTVNKPSCDMNIDVEGVVSAKTRIYSGNTEPEPVDYLSAFNVYNVEVTRTELIGHDIYVILASDTPLDKKIPFTVERGGMHKTDVTPGTAFDCQLEDGHLTQMVYAESNITTSNKPNVTFNIHVSVGYNITKQAQDKVTIEGYDQVARGSDYEFTLKFDPRYYPGQDFKVKVDGNEIVPDSNGIYKIENVKESHSITTSGGVELITFDHIIAVKTDGSEEIVAENPSNNLIGFNDIKLAYFPAGSFGTTYKGVPYYQFIVPENTAKVKIVYPEGTYSSVHGQYKISENQPPVKLDDDEYWSICKVNVINNVPQTCMNEDVRYSTYSVDANGNKVLEIDIFEYLIHKDDNGTGFGVSAIGETGEDKIGFYGVISFELSGDQHFWKKDPVYKWSDDHSTCTAQIICTHYTPHVLVSEEVNATCEMITEPTCDQKGSAIYTATFENALFKNQTESFDIPAGHDWEEPKYTWSEDNSKVIATSVCSRNPSHALKEEATITVETKEATCEEKGSVTYTATFKNKLFSTQTKEVEGDEAKGHSWDDGKVTIEPTTQSEGEMTYTCTVCKKTRTEVIDRLTEQPPETPAPETPGPETPAPETPAPETPGPETPGPETPDPQKPDPGKEEPTEQNPLSPGASAEAAEKAILAMEDDNDPEGSTYLPLKLKSSKQTKKSITVSWSKPKGATKFVIYGNKCGKANKMKKLCTVTSTKKVFKKLKKGKAYKYLIVALDKDNKVVSTSKVIHVFTKGGKITNHKSVKVQMKKGKKFKTAKSVSVKVGKTQKIRGTGIKAEKKKKIKTHVKTRYESSNPEIATVNAAGVITGVKKGKCYVYAISQNGISKKIKITVK